MADAVAQQTKLVQRKSRFSGSVFFKSIIFGFLNNPTASLNNLAQQSLLLGVKISPQGVHDRINHYAVDFMKAMFLHGFDQFKNKLALPLPILQQFSAIYLVDSTFKQLPASMTAQFPGTGGKASSAGLKVQLVFEFLQGNFAQFAIESGRIADQAYTKYLDIVEAGSLVIADLGYFRIMQPFFCNFDQVIPTVFLRFKRLAVEKWTGKAPPTFPQLLRLRLPTLETQVELAAFPFIADFQQNGTDKPQR